MEAFGIGISHAGKRRENNEDAFNVDNEIGVYIVCDGMGGHAAGEVASRMTVDALVRRIGDQRLLIRDVERAREQPQALARFLSQAVQAACAEVYEAASSDSRRAGMGTTVTALVIAGSHGVMAHVGDSRLYLYRGDALSQLSTDHTLVAEMVRHGIATREQARRGPYAHVITRAVGLQESVLVDTLVIDLVPGDRFLLCTDGLTEELEDDVMANEMTGEFEELPETLLDRALDSGGRDNVTLIAVHVQPEDEQTEDDRLWSETYDVLDAVASCRLFAGLRLANIQRIANLCELTNKEAGDRLFRRAESGTSMAILVDGRLAVIRDGQVLGVLTEAGDTVGTSFLLAACPAAADVEAAAPSRVLMLRHDRFQAFCKRRPWLGIELLARLGRISTASLTRARNRSKTLTVADWL